MTELNLGKDDVLIANIAVGNMSRSQIKEHFAEVEVSLREAFGEDQKMLFIPKRRGDTDLHILKRT